MPVSCWHVGVYFLLTLRWKPMRIRNERNSILCFCQRYLLKRGSDEFLWFCMLAFIVGDSNSGSAWLWQTWNFICFRLLFGASRSQFSLGPTQVALYTLLIIAYYCIALCCKCPGEIVLQLRMIWLHYLWWFESCKLWLELTGEGSWRTASFATQRSELIWKKRKVLTAEQSFFALHIE